MRILCTVLLAISTLAISAQIDLTTEQWREDLKFLQSTVHKDYPFLFKKTTVENFNALVENLYDEIPSLEAHEIIVGLARIVSSFEYGHTSLSLSGWFEREAFNFNQMPYNLYAFNDGVFIQGTQSQYAKALGAKVMAVEGVPIEKAMAMVKPAFPSENHQFFLAYGLSFLGNPEVLHAQGITENLEKSISLTLEKDGVQFDQRFDPIETKGFPGKYGFIQAGDGWLDARNNDVTPFYLKHLDKPYYSEFISESRTMYVRQSQVLHHEDEDIPTFYKRVFDYVEEYDVDKLVLDVRLNGGGNNYNNKPVVTGLIKSKLNEEGKLFVILGRKTYSACQNLVNEISNYTNAIFIGEPTGENINFYGDNRTVVLPNSKIPVRLSFAWWQDKPQWENDQWLAPHLAVDMSFEDYATNKDPVLETALNFKAEHFILDPMTYLTGLYQSGQIDKLQSESRRIIDDPIYEFFDFEGEFNNLGYRLLNDDQAQIAVQVFEMIVALFPESANAWDSLAEGYLSAGDHNKAIEYYNKAISLDKEGTVAKNAKSMLVKIESEKKE